MVDEKLLWKEIWKKPGSFDHFPKGTGCTPCFFRISADTKLNGAFNNSSLNSKKKKKKSKFCIFQGLHLQERKTRDLDYKCSLIASERGNSAILK